MARSLTFTGLSIRSRKTHPPSSFCISARPGATGWRSAKPLGVNVQSIRKSVSRSRLPYPLAGSIPEVLLAPAARFCATSFVRSVAKSKFSPSSRLGLHDRHGHRLYLTAEERAAFLAAAQHFPREARTLC